MQVKSTVLDAGDIPFHYVGTHRRICLKDLQAYEDRRDAARRKQLDQLARGVKHS